MIAAYVAAVTRPDGTHAALTDPDGKLIVTLHRECALMLAAVVTDRAQWPVQVLTVDQWWIARQINADDALPGLNVLDRMRFVEPVMDAEEPTPGELMAMAAELGDAVVLHDRDGWQPQERAA